MGRFFSLVCVVLVSFFSCLVTGETLRIGGLDWIGTYNESTQLDENFTLSQTIQMFIAAKVFNDRRADIVPELATLGACNLQISIEKFCDTQSDARVSTSSINSAFATNIDALVGYSTSNDGKFGAMIADVSLDLPMISHWAQSPKFADKAAFPKFSRTVVADNQYVDILFKAIVKLGYTKFSMLYHDADSGPELKAYLESKALADGIFVAFASYTPGDEASITSALEYLNFQGYTVVLFHGYRVDLIETVATVAETTKMNEKKLWFYTYADAPPVLDDYLDHPLLKKLMKDSLRVSTTFMVNQTRIDYYLNLYKTGNFSTPADLTAYNNLLPPNNAGNSRTSCADDSLPSEVDEAFFPNTVDNNFDIWWSTFDAVLAYGFAICKQDPLPLPLIPTSGQALMDLVRATPFEGMGGTVQFDEDGNRNVETVEFVLINFQDVGENDTEAVPVGFFNHSAGDWVFPNKTQFSFFTGKGFDNLPNQFPALASDQNYIPQPLNVLAFLLFGMITLFCMFCSAFLFYYRKDRIIINAQGALMQLVVLGCFVASGAIVTTVIDDRVVKNSRALDGLCMATPLLFSFGMQLAFLAIIGKMFRIYRIFYNRSAFVLSIKTRHVLAVITMVIILELCIAIAWIVRAPLRFVRTPVSFDKFGQPAESRSTCGGDESSLGFAIVVFSLHALALLVGAIFAYKVRDLPEEFQESGWLSLTILSMLQVFVIAIPAIAAVYPYSIPRFIFISTLVLLSVGAILFFLFVPKMYFIMTGKMMWRPTGSHSHSKSAGNAHHSRNDLKGSKNSRELANASVSKLSDQVHQSANVA